MSSNELVDLHCHILPGIDDGSPSLEASIELAHQAVTAFRIVASGCPPCTQKPSVYDTVAYQELAKLSGSYVETFNKMHVICQTVG